MRESEKQAELRRMGFAKIIRRTIKEWDGESVADSVNEIAVADAVIAHIDAARHQGQDEARAESVEGVSREDVAAIIANNRPAKSALRKADDILALFGAALQDLAGIRLEKATKALQDKGLSLAGFSHQDPRERIAELEAFVANVAEPHHSSDHYSMATAFERFQTRARALTKGPRSQKEA